MYRSSVPTRPITLRWSEVPGRAVDFAAIVPVSTCQDLACVEDDACEDCATSWWTPRTADLLHAVAEVELDLALDATGLRNWVPGQQDEHELDLDWLLEELPPVVAAHATPAWAVRFLGCYADLKLRMQDGQLPLPRCTGEEMALHLLLDAAQARLDDFGTEDAAGPEEMMLHHFLELQNELPRTPADYDIETLRDELFEDHDVLMLFDARLDGIDTDPVATERLGLVNLHFADWFTPFRSDKPVAPLEAGYRRPETTSTTTESRPDGAAGPVVGPVLATPGAAPQPDGPGFVFTTTRTITNRVTDPEELLDHAVACYDWPIGDVLADLGLGDAVGIGLGEVPDLFTGPDRLWDQLTGDQQRSLCRDAIGWIGGSAFELLDVPGAPEVNNLTSVGDSATDVRGRRL